MQTTDSTLLGDKKRGWAKRPSLSIVVGLSSKTQWLSGFYYADFISFYSPTQLCGGGTTKSNSKELPIAVPRSFDIQFLIFQDNFTYTCIFLQFFKFFWIAYKCDDIAFFTHTPCTSSTVSVGFRISRDIKVNHTL